MARYDVSIPNPSRAGALRSGGQSNHIVYVSATVWYSFAVSSSNSDLYWAKTTNAGVTWGIPVLIKTGTIMAIAAWYDKWTPSDTGTLIHMAYMDTTSHDVFYQALDTADDGLDGEVVVFAGASFAEGASSCLSITKTREPMIIIAFDGDGGTECGTMESVEYPPTTSPFTTLTDINEATSDYYWLAPGNETGTDEFYALFFDRSAGALTLKYGNGGGAYTEVGVGTLTNVASTTVAPQVAICIGTNSHTYVVWWTNQDNVAADLNFADITNGATVGSAVKILDSTDDQGGCALGIDTDDGMLYVFYLGKTDGSDTAYTSMSVNRRTSSDSGVSWSGETTITQTPHGLTNINCSLEFAGGIYVVSYAGVDTGGTFTFWNAANIAGGGGLRLAGHGGLAA